MNKEAPSHSILNRYADRVENDLQDMEIGYESVIAQVKYWHGTGRYQYDENGEIVDILRRILSTGCLNIKPDLYNTLAQGKSTISFSDKRFIVVKGRIIEYGCRLCSREPLCLKFGYLFLNIYAARFFDFQVIVAPLEIDHALVVNQLF